MIRAIWLVYLITDIMDIPDKLSIPEGLCGIFEPGLALLGYL